jgi:hypothetical protein
MVRSNARAREKADFEAGWELNMTFLVQARPERCAVSVVLPFRVTEFVKVYLNDAFRQAHQSAYGNGALGQHR